MKFLKFLKFLKFHPPEVAPPVRHADPNLLARDLAEADKLHVAAERQAHAAAVVTNDLRQVNLRNGFAPAIERSVRRKYGEAT